MLATWGLSLGLIAVVSLVLGPTTEGVGTPLGHFTVGGYVVAVYDLFVVAVAITCVALTWLIFKFMKFELIARGTMQNAKMVAALGIHPPAAYMATFGFGAALAGLAGAIMAPLTGVVPTLGLAFIAKVFITVSAGGTAIFAAMLGAAGLLGAVESAVSFLYNADLWTGRDALRRPGSTQDCPTGNLRLMAAAQLNRLEPFLWGAAALAVALLPTVLSI
ncbi:MAG: ABC transporter permease subunit [Acetobacteraceae bacterium]